jgi:hypothetical protein
MTKKTQAALEEKLIEWLGEAGESTVSEEQIPGNLEDWTMDAGSRKALLHPGFRQWLWYDRLHEEWVFAGCGINEAILVSSGAAGGIKKLPETGPVGEWCLYLDGEDLVGPLRISELRQRLDEKEDLKDIKIWSTLAADWFSPEDEVGKKILS